MPDVGTFLFNHYLDLEPLATKKKTHSGVRWRYCDQLHTDKGATREKSVCCPVRGSLL